MFDLGDIVDMLQRNFPNAFFAGSTTSPKLVLTLLHPGGLEQEIRCGWCSKFEVKRTVRANGDSSRYGNPGCHVSCACVELLPGCQLLEAR